MNDHGHVLGGGWLLVWIVALTILASALTRQELRDSASGGRLAAEAPAATVETL